MVAGVHEAIVRRFLEAERVVGCACVFKFVSFVLGEGIAGSHGHTAIQLQAVFFVFGGDEYGTADIVSVMQCYDVLL